MRVFIVIENMRDYTLCADSDMQDVLVGVFRSQEEAFRAGQAAAALFGYQAVGLRDEKYIVSSEGHILYEIVSHDIL